MTNKVDIKENDILELDKALLPLLLKDNSSKENIIWATDNYAHLGEGYQSQQQIKESLITGDNGMVIRPRVSKTKEEQLSRVREKAEVFTPSWVCNAQNNLVDDIWFGEKEVFNVEGDKEWLSTPHQIVFPTSQGKSWQDYVQDVRLEITCGEAPYLVSRYDTITGEPIDIKNRIGLLDRKLRVVSENTSTKEDWLQWAKVAIQSIYGFEWQGDSLLLARENVLYTFVDYFNDKFNGNPPKENIREIAKIISWNLWQMDGLKGVIPNSCRVVQTVSQELFGEVSSQEQMCEGCAKGNIHRHNGIYCKIKDWTTGGVVKYVSLIQK